MRYVGTISILLLSVATIGAAPRPGEVYEIRNEKLTSQQYEGGTGSSTDVDTLIERVVSVRDGGLELEYDLPGDTTAAERASSWQFPVRVFKSASGQLQLLNGPELAKRVDSWLKAGKMSRAACGHWIFTWNAFKIDCDPQSVMSTLAHFDLQSTDLRKGMPYRDEYARGPVPLKKMIGSQDVSLMAEAAVDPEQVRRDRAQADVATGEIMGKPVTLDDALRAHSAERISGTINAIFDLGPDGEVRRRKVVRKITIKGSDGKEQTSTSTETTERHRVSDASSRNDITI